MNDAPLNFTDVPGIAVGHYTDATALTGCTVVLTPEGAVAGVDVRGCAPGTRETDSLRPGNLVQQAHAVVLSGGSAFGLDACGGDTIQLAPPFIMEKHQIDSLVQALGEALQETH